MAPNNGKKRTRTALYGTSKGLFVWARSTGLARFLRSRLATLFFVKISMCSYERPGWPGYRDLGFCDRDLGNRDENFPIWTLQPGDRAICGLSLLIVVLYLLREVFLRYSGFSLLKTKLTFPIPIRSWNARTFLNELLWIPRCSVGNQITELNFLGEFTCLFCVQLYQSEHKSKV